MFQFSTHPGAVTVSDGIQTAFAYLQVSWRRWLPVVGVIAVCSFLMHAIIGTVDTRNLYYINNYTGEVTWDQQGFNTYLTSTAATSVVIGILSLIGGWVFNATAIAGLRNRPLTVSFVVNRGLLTLVAGIVIGLAITAAAIVWVIILVIVPPVGLLLLLVAVPAAIYVSIRLIFYNLAIFDGFGPIAGLQESWRLSQGSVLRLFGWGLMAILIGFGFGLLAGAVALPLSGSTGLQPLAQAFSSAVTTTASVLTVFLMAVLYESQRARLDPSLYQFTPAPGYPGPYPSGPAPYPDGPYPSGPGPSWPGYPPAYPPTYPPAAPPNQGGIPGWINPNAAPSWPGYPPAYPSAPPAPDPKPMDPPTSHPTDPPDSTPGA